MLKPTLVALVALSLPALAQACPDINGQFTRKFSEGNTTTSITVGLKTQITNGKYFYNFDTDGQGPFLEADGIEKSLTHEGTRGTIKISCSGNTVEFEAKADGGPMMKGKYILLSPSQLQIESADPEMSGVFEKN